MHKSKQFYLSALIKLDFVLIILSLILKIRLFQHFASDISSKFNYTNEVVCIILLKPNTSEIINVIFFEW
jgi:hypothetical protein